MRERLSSLLWAPLACARMNRSPGKAGYSYLSCRCPDAPEKATWKVSPPILSAQDRTLDLREEVAIPHSENSSGKVVSETPSLSMRRTAWQVRTKGAVYSLEAIESACPNVLLAGVNNKLQVYQWENLSVAASRGSHLASHRISLSSRGHCNLSQRPPAHKIRLVRIDTTL